MIPLTSAQPILGLQARPAGSNLMLIAVLALSVALLAVIVGVLVFAKILLPRKRRRPVLEAIGLLSSQDEDDIRRAETLLMEAVTTGLRKRDLPDARFALAYARAILSKYREAATTVAELRASGSRDRETLYLELWLQARLENHDTVRELYEENAGTLGDLLQTRLIVSISYLHLARDRWRLKEVEGTLHFFQRIRELEQLADRVPGHVDDLQIVNGVRAVFDGRMDDARRSFDGARERALERGDSAAEARLGLLVCDWRSADLPDVDGPLAEILDELEARMPESPAGAPVRAGGGGPGPGRGQDADETVLLQANACFLHAISLLYVWLMRLPARHGLPAASHDELRRRLRRVLRHDQELGDALLIEGLIGYYFADSDDAKREALEALEEGSRKSKGILLPEARELLERERRLERELGDALARYLSLVRNYLTDDGVPVALRQELRRKLQVLSLYGELGELHLDGGEHGAAPSVEDIRHRGALLRRRIGTLVQPRLRQEHGGARPLEELLERLETATSELATNVNRVELAEQALVLRTGEFLLPEEAQDRSAKKGKGERGGG